MSDSNTETTRKFYDFFMAGKIEDAAQLLAEDFVLTNPLPDPIPFGGRFEGPAGFLQYIGGIAGQLEIKDFAVDEILSDGENVVVTGRERSLVVPSGREYEMDWVHVLRVSQGRIHSLREYNDTAAMRDAH